MSNDDFALGDDSIVTDPSINAAAFSPEVIKKQDENIKDAVSDIQKVGKITEEDKRKLNKVSKSANEAEELSQLVSDFSEFINSKVEIDNDGGGTIERIPTGIDLLDAIAGGGFGVGCFSLIAGNPGTFKSALLSQIIASGQRKFKGRLLTTYHDSETAMTSQRLASMGVVNPLVEPYTDVTIENVFKTIEAVCAFKDAKKIESIPSIVAWDSIANTETAKARTTDDINQTIGLKARMLSQLFPRYLPKMKKYNISLIAVNQLREKLEMGRFAPPSDLQHMGNKDIPGGQAVKFNAFHLLMLRNRGDIKFEQYGFNGIRLEAFFVKNKFFRPNVPVTLLVDFNTGISNFWSNYNFLVTYKRINSGAWNTLVAMPELKFRTKDALEMHKNDVKFRTAFDKEVKDTIQNEILSGKSITKVQGAEAEAESAEG